MSPSTLDDKLLQKALNAVASFRFGLLTETEFENIKTHPHFIASLKEKFDKITQINPSAGLIASFYPDSWYTKQYYLRMVKPANTLTEQELFYLDPKGDPTLQRNFLAIIQSKSQ